MSDHRWFVLIITLSIALVIMLAINIDMGSTIGAQQETIRQYMGLEHGTDDGPAMPDPPQNPGLLDSPQRQQNVI